MNEVTLHPERNSFIDIVRVIACFGVVTIHVHNSTVAAETLSRLFLDFCVPYFYITAIAYFIRSFGKDILLKNIFYKMWQRICLPFGIWSVIYTSLLILKGQITGNGYIFNAILVFVYGGSTEHMYYLPELMIMQLIIIGVCLLVFNIKQTIGIILIIITTCYLTWGYIHNLFGVTPFKNIISYVIMGFFIAPKLNRPGINWFYLLFAILLIILTLTESYIDYPILIREYIISLPLGGIGLLLLSINMPNVRLFKSLTLLTSTTYGVYLSHIMFLEAFEYGMEKIHYNVHYNLLNKLIVVFFIYIICLIFTLIIRSSRVLSPLLLGEPGNRLTNKLAMV